MHCPVGQVEEEGLVLVFLDHVDRFVGPVVGEITARLEPRAFIVGRGILHARPQEGVDRVERHLGVDNVGVVLLEVQAARHHQGLVKPLRIRPELRPCTRVPLADMRGVIARAAQHFGNGHFRSRQTLPGIGRSLLRLLLVVDHRRQARFVRVVQHRDHASHAIRRRGELETRARGIAPRHDHRARRRAGCRSGIGLGKDSTTRGEAIDIWCRHAPAGHSATEGTDVVDAKIVREDEDNVRLALR